MELKFRPPYAIDAILSLSLRLLDGVISTQVRNKPPSLAMGERLEQAIASLKACRAAPSLPENKQKEVDIALKAAKDYQLRTCEACKQQ